MGFVCTVCGQYHDERLLDAVAPVPDRWLELSRWQRVRSRRARSICRIRDGLRDRFYLRGIVELPVAELDDSFRWGVWAEVGREDFERAWKRWDDADAAGDEYRGTLDNHLPYPAETRGLAVLLRERGGDDVPLIEVLEDAHPLAHEQRSGISVERADELAAPYVHQPRSSGSPRADQSLHEPG